MRTEGIALTSSDVVVSESWLILGEAVRVLATVATVVCNWELVDS